MPRNNITKELERGTNIEFKTAPQNITYNNKSMQKNISNNRETVALIVIQLYYGLLGSIIIFIYY